MTCNFDDTESSLRSRSHKRVNTEKQFEHEHEHEHKHERAMSVTADNNNDDRGRRGEHDSSWNSELEPDRHTAIQVQQRTTRTRRERDTKHGARGQNDGVAECDPSRNGDGDTYAGAF